VLIIRSEDVPDKCCKDAKRLCTPSICAIIPSHCTPSLLFVSQQ
jgi:hypothetical protein